MNHFQLFLETSDPELFRKATCELGTIFFHQSKSEPDQWLIVYFSGSRVAKFEASGFEVEEIDLNVELGTLRVRQRNGGKEASA